MYGNGALLGGGQKKLGGINHVFRPVANPWGQLTHLNAHG
jgi:hypothetical protein